VVFPSTNGLQEKLAEQYRHAPTTHDDNIHTAFQAGSVATTALLAHLIVATTTDDNADHPSLLDGADSLLDKLLATALFANRDMIWSYPAHRPSYLRRNDDQDCSDNASEASERRSIYSYWTRQQGSSDELAGMRTGLDDLGFALLAARAFQQQPTAHYSTNADKTNQDGFELYLSYVATLLFVTCEDMTPDGGVDNDIVVDGRVIDRFHYAGLNLLQALLDTQSNESLANSWSEPAESHDLSSPPSAVLGTMQLLANRMVHSAVPSRRSTLKGSTDDISFQLHDSTRAFQLMKQLVSKYQAAAQLDLVQTLMMDCPHLGLRPKLLDLLRNAVSWSQAADAMPTLWRYLETFLIEMETHDVADDDLAQVLHSVEVYDALLNLIYLLSKVRKIQPDIPDLHARLCKVMTSVTRLLRRKGDEDVDDGGDAYRLYLLESSLQKLIERLSL
jgi:hypothetical protein